jgi:hypothetical protein
MFELSASTTPQPTPSPTPPRRKRDRRRTLTKIDMRSRLGKRIAELTTLYSAALGGDRGELSPVRKFRIVHAAQLTALSEQASRRPAAGRADTRSRPPGTSGRLCGAQLGRIGAEASAADPDRNPSAAPLAAMIRRRRTCRPAAPLPPPRPPLPRDCFDWLPERELVVGVGTSKRGSDVLARCQALYTPTPPKGETE